MHLCYINYLLGTAFMFVSSLRQINVSVAMWTICAQHVRTPGRLIGNSSIVAGVTSTVAADQPSRSIWFSKVRCTQAWSPQLLYKSASENDPISYFSRRKAYFYEGNRSPSLGDSKNTQNWWRYYYFAPPKMGNCMRDMEFFYVL